ncbi:MAG: hypothetical protein ACYS74_20620, partial [Planctomycetota bacterium]
MADWGISRVIRDSELSLSAIIERASRDENKTCSTCFLFVVFSVCGCRRRCRSGAGGEEDGRRNSHRGPAAAQRPEGPACHILPWFSWPRGNSVDSQKNAQRFHSYYDELMAYCRELKLPICFRGTQWEAMLLGKEYRELPPEKCPAVIGADRKTIRKLSPFGPIEPWRDPARRYVDTPAMKRLQRMYPDPPLVLFVGNNEAPDLRWHQVEQSKRYLDKYGRGRPDQFKRKVVGQGWIERYPVMFEAMREALMSDTWRKNLRFVGYGAFGPSHFGRWSGWKEYSLISDQWTSP